MGKKTAKKSAKKRARKPGRPALYTPKLAEAILTRISDGESLRSICRDDTMPSMKTVTKWCGTQPEFLRQYAQARLNQADAYHDEVVQIADDDSDDVRVVTVKRNGKDVQIGVVNSVAVHRARLRADVRLRVAARLNPKKYGDKLGIGDVTDDFKDLTDVKLNAMAADRLKKLGVLEMLTGFKLTAEQIAQVVALFQITELPTGPTPEPEESAP